MTQLISATTWRIGQSRLGSSGGPVRHSQHTLTILQPTSLTIELEPTPGRVIDALRASPLRRSPPLAIATPLALLDLLVGHRPRWCCRSPACSRAERSSCRHLDSLAPRRATHSPRSTSQGSAPLQSMSAGDAPSKGRSSAAVARRPQRHPEVPAPWHHVLIDTNRVHVFPAESRRPGGPTLHKVTSDRGGQSSGI